MTTSESLLREYAQSHRHPVNRVIHLVCVPVIFVASFGLAWSAAWPHASGLGRLANLAIPGALAVLVVYARIGRLGSGAAWVAAALAICAALGATGAPLFALSLGAWLIAWVAQFVGHYLEGAKPAFGRDLVFLLVGPLFVQDEMLGREVAAAGHG